MRIISLICIILPVEPVKLSTHSQEALMLYTCSLTGHDAYLAQVFVFRNMLVELIDLDDMCAVDIGCAKGL